MDPYPTGIEDNPWIIVYRTPEEAEAWVEKFWKPLSRHQAGCSWVGWDEKTQRGKVAWVDVVSGTGVYTEWPVPGRGRPLTIASEQ